MKSCRSKVMTLGLSLLLTLGSPTLGQSNPSPSAQAYANLAGEQFSQGKYKDAIQSASECLRLDPGSVDCNFVRGLSYYATSNYDAAILDLTIYVQAQPTNPQGFEARAECYVEKGDFEAAIADLDASLALVSNSQTLSRRNAIQTEQHVNLVYKQISEGKIDESIKNASECLKLDPKKHDCYLMRASAYHLKGDLEAAISDLSEYIALQPNAAQGYAQRGGHYLERKDYAAAIADLSKALELKFDPKVQKQLEQA